MPGKMHIGKAGHLAVMAELANRGYNIAIPEIDIGDDIFAVNDANGNMWRVQVKTGVAKLGVKVTSAQFRLRASSITTPLVPDLHFVFAIRLAERYRFVVISRAVLHNYVQAQQMGSPSSAGGTNWRSFHLSITNATGVVTCSGVVVSHHMEDWTTWPVI